MSQLSLPTHIVTELAEISISHLSSLGMLKISCTCLISLIKNLLSHIQNLSKPSKYCSFFMQNINLIAQQLQSDICHHQELMFIPVLLEPQALCMGQNMVEPMKQFWECLNKLEKNKIFLSLLKTLKVERNFFMALVIESTKVTIQEQR